MDIFVYLDTKLLLSKIRLNILPLSTVFSDGGAIVVIMSDAIGVD